MKLLNEKYKEILRLEDLLKRYEIPHVLQRSGDGWQIFYPNAEERLSDVIEFTGSYGAENDLLEIMGLLTDEELEKYTVAGYLTAEDVFSRWQAHFVKEQNK